MKNQELVALLRNAGSVSHLCLESETTFISRSDIMKQHTHYSFLEKLESRALLSAVKIMPLGDSITESFVDHASYRFFLYNQLVQAGYNVDFVGTKHGVNGGSPLYSNFDQDHEGHSGDRADEVATNVEQWATQTKPDVVLLHLGSNDLEQDQSNSTTIDDLSDVIANLRAAVPKVKILLAQIITEQTRADDFADLNGHIATLATQLNTKASPVVLVDQNTGFDADVDTFDGVHPDESGERKLANNWLKALTKVLPKPASTKTTFLSDLKPTKVENGWGPVEKDQSNGEDAANDGELLSINGIGYLKGLGVNPTSDLTYKLNGKYTQFATDIGIDDDVDEAGSAVFKVFVDGKSRYTSPVMTGVDGKISISIPLAKNAKSLRLVVEPNGDDGSFDHADWANARLLGGSSAGSKSKPAAPSRMKAVFNTSSNAIDLSWRDNAKDEAGIQILRRAGEKGKFKPIADLAANTTEYSDKTELVTGTRYYYQAVAYKFSGVTSAAASANVKVPTSLVTYLSDLGYFTSENGAGPAESDRSNGGEDADDGNTITIGGVTYDKGVGVQAPSELIVNLNGRYKRFISDFGMDDEATNGAVTFQVFADDRLIYDSGMYIPEMGIKKLNMNVTSVARLRLIVSPLGDTAALDHADWADARFTS